MYVVVHVCSNTHAHNYNEMYLFTMHGKQASCGLAH